MFRMATPLLLQNRQTQVLLVLKLGGFNMAVGIMEHGAWGQGQGQGKSREECACSLAPLTASHPAHT